MLINLEYDDFCYYDDYNFYVIFVVLQHDIIMTDAKLCISIMIMLYLQKEWVCTSVKDALLNVHTETLE